MLSLAALLLLAPPLDLDAKCDQAHAAAITDYLQGLCVAQPAWLPNDAALLGVDRAPEAPAFGIWVQVGAEETRFEGLIVNPARLRIALKEARAKQLKLAQLGGPPADGVLVLAVAPGALVERVVEAITAAERVGFTSARFLFEAQGARGRPGPVNPEGLAALKAMLAQNPQADQRAAWVAEQVSLLIGECEGVSKAFEAVAAAPVDQRCQVLARGVGPGYVGCRCAPDLEALLTYLYLFNDARALTSVTVKLDEAAPSHRWMKGQRWREVGAGVIALDGRPSRFAITAHAL